SCGFLLRRPAAIVGLTQTPQALRAWAALHHRPKPGALRISLAASKGGRATPRHGDSTAARLTRLVVYPPRVLRVELLRGRHPPGIDDRVRGAGRAGCLRTGGGQGLRRRRGRAPLPELDLRDQPAG